MSLLQTMIGASTSQIAEILSESSLMQDKDVTRTRIPALNIALSGEIDGGLTSGLTVFAGPSRHFKSNIGLVCVSSYLKKYPDAVCIFLDTEFGITPAYLKSMDVDPDRVIHVQCEHIERMKFEMAVQLKKMKERKDKAKKSDPKERVIFFIDSVGNAASIKEMDDAEAEKGTADMTRAKQLKSLFRICTPYFTMLDIPCIAVNHTYQTQEMFSKTVMSGGTGIMYSSDTVIILGRQQQKDGKELTGYNFIMNSEKSRFVREKSKIPLEVSFEGGINTFSGLLDIALDIGFVQKPSNGWFSRRDALDVETGEITFEEKKWRRDATNSVEFWKPLFQQQEFKDAIKKKFKLGAMDLADTVDLSEDLYG